MTLQNEKQFLTFDRIKIKCDYKYFHNAKAKFNEMFNSRSGERTGIFYSSREDKNVPYNLYIAISCPPKKINIRIFQQGFKRELHKINIKRDH